MKKFILLNVLLCFFTFSVCASAFIENEFCEFSSTKKIIDKKILHDFGENEFFLYELDDGYAIYALIDDQEIFVEGSYKTNSIYSSLVDETKLFYLGPGEYYFQKENLIHSIRTGEVYECGELDATYTLHSVPLVSNLQMNRNSTQASHTDENGFTVVKEDKYFKNLSNFPKNWFGECGLIALSILLGYLDTFHNDNFIPNDKFYSSRYYVDNGSIDEDGDEIYDSVSIKDEELIEKVLYPFVDGTSYSLESWPTFAMPGTSYAMRDYLIDNYLHTYGFWETPGLKDLKKNRPSLMADEELKKTLNDYMNANCSSLLSNINIRSGNVFFTHQHPKDYIDLGVPTILILADYTYQSRGVLNTEWHDVVAYGYKDDKFLVHMGWWPGSKSFAEIVLSSATIYGYFAVEYTGTHVHSKNVCMEKNNITYYICGCGYKHNHEHIYSSYEKIDNSYHYSICSCGENVKEFHDWSLIMQKARKPKAKKCNKCGLIVLL